MENIEFQDFEFLGETTTYVIIDRGNGEFTSMPKAVWDELEAAKENGTIS
jgi:acyl-CoA thioesterase FadM